MNFKVLASENQIMFCKIGISIYYYAEFARETEISTYTYVQYICMSAVRKTICFWRYE